MFENPLPADFQTRPRSSHPKSLFSIFSPLSLRSIFRHSSSPLSCADASDAKRVPPAHSILTYPAGTRRRRFLSWRKIASQIRREKDTEQALRQWEKLEEETGSLDKRPLDRKPKIDLDALRKYCEEFPFATHIEAGVHFGCSERVIRYAKDKLGITRKKRHLITQSEMKPQGQSLPKS